jgi:hypothetical protein
MRTNFFAGLALTALTVAACGGESPLPQAPPPPPPPPPAMASATIAPAETPPPAPPPKPVLSDVIPRVLKGLHDADIAHDSDKQATFLADDVAVHFYGSQGKAEMHGKGDAVDRFKKTLFSDAKTAPTRVWIKGNVAVVEYTWVGTMTGDAKDLKATNKPIGQKRAIVYAFNDDGLVKEERIYSDNLGLRAQMKGDKNAPAIEPLPTGAPEVHVAKGTPDEDKLVDWARKIDDAFNTGDVKQPIAFVADDMEYDAWGAPPLKGKKAVVKDLQAFFKAFPDQKWTPTNVMGIDGFVVIEHVFIGTQKMPYGRFAKVTGKPITGEHYLEVWQPSADGKVIYDWAYANPVEALQQTGVMEKGQEKPAPSAAASK